MRTAAGMAKALAAGACSSLELVDAAIARIEARDGALNAVVVRDFERARGQARAADAALARGERRPLLGVPMTVKESFHVAGLPTTWGVAGTGAAVAATDAVAVARLKAAGAVLLGKTNVSVHLGDWQSVNPVYGRTANPWDLRRTPGGSSGGAAAALAAGFVPLELGSDLAGSLRVPAHCCGIYAHKPTLGLLPARGHAPPGAPDLSVGVEGDLGVVGPMATSAADLELAMDLLAGPDLAQATGYRLALPPPRHERLAGHRILLLTGHPLLPSAQEVQDALQACAARLRAAGCQVAEASPLLPDLRLAATTFTQLLMAFLGANFPAPHYAAIAEQAAHPPAGTQDAAAQRRRALVASHRDWMLAHRRRTFLAHQWRAFFEAFDLVLCPVLPVVAFAHDDREMDERRIEVDGIRLPYADLATWAGPATLCGLPATALPIGQGAGGLPIGAQLIGPYLEDRTPLRFAALAEAACGGFVAPPAYA
jgi:amidase